MCGPKLISIMMILSISSLIFIDYAVAYIFAGLSIFCFGVILGCIAGYYSYNR